MLDYELLRIIWWALLGILLIGFVITDGFDMGTMILLFFAARNESERRVIINTVGPVWEGNQVWLILGAGAIFAAWPTIYSVAFSALYQAMLLVLMALILRPVCFKFRSKFAKQETRTLCDVGLFISGLLPAILFGVAVGNVMQGIGFEFDEMMRASYTGTFWQLLNPFALFCGATSLAMFISHGGYYLAIKTEAPVQRRAVKLANTGAVCLLVLFAIGHFFVGYGVDGYLSLTELAHDGYSNPMRKEVTQLTGGWLLNFQTYPSLLLVPALGFIGTMAAAIFAYLKRNVLAFWASSFGIMGIIATVGVSMFPFILPSNSNPNISLTVWDASSSQMTLMIMLVATLIFLPIVLAYTTWVYRVLRGKVTTTDIEQNSESMY